jgi:hypothetical protein
MAARRAVNMLRTACAPRKGPCDDKLPVAPSTSIPAAGGAPAGTRLLCSPSQCFCCLTTLLSNNSSARCLHIACGSPSCASPVFTSQPHLHRPALALRYSQCTKTLRS